MASVSAMIFSLRFVAKASDGRGVTPFLNVLRTRRCDDRGPNYAFQRNLGLGHHSINADGSGTAEGSPGVDAGVSMANMRLKSFRKAAMLHQCGTLSKTWAWCRIGTT